jgi:formylglycine-generating enzyme required for sulfatase activity
MKQTLLILFLAFAAHINAFANNLNVTNVTISGQNNALQYKLVNFDISWENSWYIKSGPNNWDAAWVFVKYKRKSDNSWHHATLHFVDGTGAGDGHTEPANSNIRSSNDTGAGGAHGVFIHRTNPGQGTVSYIGVSLRWDYGIDGLGDEDNVELCVMGIEMVYVPKGSFYVGSGGTETAPFHTYPIATNPYLINSEAAIDVGANTGYLYYATGYGDQLGPIPAVFPKGYNDFYCMKYEITQNQYVAFLNKLIYTQQVTRTAVTPSSAAGTAAMTTGALSRNGIDIMTPGIANSLPAVYACNLDNDATYNEVNDGQSIACNHLSWADVVAYLDWSALRPLTDLEYEKASRGNQAPVANEYAWGNTTITGATTISNSGLNTELAQAGANCVYNSGVTGPMRSGNFAQAATSRTSAGASYYGIMELSGNLWELLVTIVDPQGRNFNAQIGNGVLDGIGNANVPFWPSSAAAMDRRGGDWMNLAAFLRLSDRSLSLGSDNNRTNVYGGRDCRAVP